MKKFLVFFAVLFGIISGGWGAQQTDPKTKETNDCVLVPQDWWKEPYAVYFNTGFDVKSDECADDFAYVARELNAIKDDVSYFVVVASADGQGEKNGYDNGGLSQRRYENVIREIVPSGAKIGEPSGWAAGAITDTRFNRNYGSNWKYRAVYIYPQAIFNEPVKCNQNFLDGLEQYARELDDIEKKCASDEDGECEAKEKVEKEIEKARNQIEQCKAKCPKPEETVWDQNTVNYVNAHCRNHAMFAVIKKEVPRVVEKIVREDNSSEIDILYANMKAIIAGLRLSVWRDSEGKFNTARLASDSIAGVVLGTVGGIVTANVVKKNQLKKGFEDINCSVGGQNAAKYGDQMRVGLQ